MHNVSIDPHLFLQGRERQVVPLVVFGDDSDFSREAMRMLASITEPGMAAAVLQGDLSDPEPAIAQVTSVGFQQRMSPLRLWTHQPLWCAWIAYGKTISPEDLAHRIASLRVPGSSGAEHFVFLHVSNGECPDCRSMTDLAKAASALFLVSDQGAVHRPLGLLAEGAVSLLYSGWKDYCLAVGHSLNEPMLLVQDERVYLLGASANEPDWDYHAFCWEQEITAAVLREWRNPISRSVQSGLETAKQSLERLLRFGEGWRGGEVVVQSLGSHDSQQPILRVGKELLRATCQVNQERRATEPQDGSARRKLAAWLGQIKSMDVFLRFVALSNFRRLIQSRSLQMEKDWLGNARDFVRDDQPVRGFLGNVHQRLLALHEWAKDRAFATVLNQEEVSFNQQERDVLKRISDVPNGIGLALRLMLVASGLFWLFLAPVWASINTGWQGDIVDTASVTAGAFFLLILVTGIGHWLYFRWRALRAVERIRQSIHVGFQSQFSSILAGALNRAGKQVAEDSERWLQEFAHLSEEFCESRKIEETEPQNRNPFFPKACLASIFDDRVGSLAQAAHERFSRQWAEDHHLSFAPEKWRMMITEAARQISREALNTLSYSTCLKARKPSAQELSFLVASLCHEARMPCLNIASPANPPSTVLLGHGDGFSFLNKLRDVRIRDLHTSKLLAVAVIPYPVHS